MSAPSSANTNNTNTASTEGMCGIGVFIERSANGLDRTSSCDKLLGLYQISHC